MSRPFVAVPAYALAEGRVKGWEFPAIGAPARYLEALHRAGAQEGVLMPVALDDGGEADDLLEHFDALLLLGGGDLDPARYDQERHTKVYGVVPERDAFEIALACAAIERRMPVLAICRGHQVLNVALGGTLLQHLAADGHGAPGVPGGSAMHAVRIEPGSRMAAATDASRFDVCSHHHQAVDALGDGLRAVAWADDGTIEGIELDGDAWAVGAQWHPEDTAAEDPIQQRLFDAFVAQARAGNQRT
ncbi:MAG TPA: gamma-glutamyl-gamma-aminobutyrate hydrolase family protein [Acidimicrobiia bacterium]